MSYKLSIILYVKNIFRPKWLTLMAGKRYGFASVTICAINRKETFMRDFSIAETYVLMALLRKPEQSFLMSSVIISGVVLSCLYDSVLNGIARIDSKGRMCAQIQPSEEYIYLQPLYENLKKMPERSMEKWFKSYCYQVRQRDNKILLESVVDYMKKNDDLWPIVRRGFLGRTKTSYSINSSNLSKISDKVIEALKADSEPSISLIVLLALATTSGLEKSLYNLIPKSQCQRIISICKRDNNWKFVKNSIGQIQNQYFDYQLSSYQQ